MTAPAKPLDIVTVGGSLAGLITSIVLRRLGHNVRIFERSPMPLLHDQGAGIVAGGDTEEFLSRYDKSRTQPAVNSHLRLYLDRQGNVAGQEAMSQQMTSWDLMYHVCRANFDDLKTEYVKSPLAKVSGEGTAAYLYGREVTGLERQGDQVRVSFRSTLPGDNRDVIRHEMADFVVLADGPSASMRTLLNPALPRRTYAGYVAFRGIVSESELSDLARETFVDKFPFYHSPGIQILAYTIPGRSGTLEQGARLVNWVWYWNVRGDSDEYREIMTDRDGKPHRWSLPPGDKMNCEVWKRQKGRAADLLPPQFIELVEKTARPFVQAITDLEPPRDGKCWVLGGKGVLVGDALAGFRPHTAGSTSQAAFHALTLIDVFQGRLSKEKYQHEVIQYATGWQRRGVMLGNRSQFQDLSTY